MDQKNPKKEHRQASTKEEADKDENGWEDQKIDAHKNRGNRQGRGNRNQQNQAHSARRIVSYGNEHEDIESNFEGNNDQDQNNDEKEKNSLSFSQVDESKTKEKQEYKESKSERRTTQYEQILKDLAQEKDAPKSNKNGSNKKQENMKVKQDQFEDQNDEIESSWFQDSQQSDPTKTQNTSVSLIQKQIKSDHEDINTTLSFNPTKKTQKNQANQSAPRGNRGNRQMESDFKKKTFYQDLDQNYRSSQNYREGGRENFDSNHTKRYYGDSYEMGRGGRGGRGEDRGKVRGGGRGGRGGRGTYIRQRQQFANNFRQSRENQFSQNQEYSNRTRQDNFNGNRQQTNFRENGNRYNDKRGNWDNDFGEEHVPRNYNRGKYNESDRFSNRNQRDQPENYPRNNRQPGNFERSNQKSNQPIKNGHYLSQEPKKQQQHVNEIKNGHQSKQVVEKQPKSQLKIQPRGQKCWPQVSIYIQSTKLTFGYRQIAQYECDVIIIPYKNQSFDIYPGNILNRCSVDYREKIRNKGEEIAKAGSLYAQKCVGIPNFKILGFLKMGTGYNKESLSQIIPQLKKIKASFQTVLIPFSADMGQPKQFIQTIAESINGNRGFTEIHLSTNNAKEYRQGFKAFNEYIDQLIEQNKICIDF